MVGEMMRAVFATGMGTVEVRDVPAPHAAAGQVRIKVAGVGLNYADRRIIGGGHVGSGIGLELAGTVDEVGAGADLEIGTRVAAVHLPIGTPTGSAAEYIVVPAAHVARVPSSVDLVDAATVTMNALTAQQLLGMLGEGRRMLVTGAAGGVGGYIVALAARDGWEVTALARDTDTEFLTRAGAARVITSLDGETGFDVVTDTALLNEAAMKAVRDNGMYAGVYPEAEPPSERGITVKSVFITPDGAAAEELLDLTVQGVLEVRRAATVTFDDVLVAYEALEKGGQRGRWVVTP